MPLEKKDESGPAFPRLAQFDEDGALVSEDSKGMTLRQWYAGQALPGLLAAMANPVYAASCIESAERRGQTLPTQMAVECFELADALVKESAK